MNVAAADGGGGAGGGSFGIDQEAARSANDQVSAAAEDLDGSADGAPGTGGTGQAEPLLADILSTVAWAGSRLGQEAGLVHDIGTEMINNYGDVDAAVDTVLARVAAVIEEGS